MHWTKNPGIYIESTFLEIILKVLIKLLFSNSFLTLFLGGNFSSENKKNRRGKSASVASIILNVEVPGEFEYNGRHSCSYANACVHHVGMDMMWQYHENFFFNFSTRQFSFKRLRDKTSSYLLCILLHVKLVHFYLNF